MTAAICRLYPAMHPMEVLDMRIDLMRDLLDGVEALGERLERQAGNMGGGQLNRDGETRRNADGTITRKITTLASLASFLQGSIV